MVGSFDSRNSIETEACRNDSGFASFSKKPKAWEPATEKTA